MKHSDRPKKGDLFPSELQQRAESLFQGDYFEYLQPLQASVVGKTVVSSQAGTSGFLLSFGDDTWVAAYLSGGRLEFELGHGTPQTLTLDRLSSQQAGDASKPLGHDYPYGWEPCDIGGEVLRSHGQPVVGLAYGKDCFNFCFPNGVELDTNVVKDPQGRTALRVFWEQW